eukprot:gene8193-9039_t
MLRRKDKKVSPIEELEGTVQADPTNFSTLCQLLQLYYQQKEGEDLPSIVHHHIDTAVSLFTQNGATSIPLTDGWVLVEILLDKWKIERFVIRGNLSLNTSIARKQVLTHLETVLSILAHKKDDDKSYSQRISLTIAYVKECQNRLGEALAILSDLITMQATDQVDLSFIILKASFLLSHVGQKKQAIEYLEFLRDDPPQEGFSQMHIQAYLILAYESGGGAYQALLTKAYADLHKICQEAHNKHPNKQTKRLVDLVGNSSVVTKTSELWEILAVHALDRCEYVIAAEILAIGVKKAAAKGPLLQRYAEVLFLLGDKENAEKVGSKAFEVLPDSSELRDLLVQIAPEKWSDQLRFTSIPHDSSSLGGYVGGWRKKEKESQIEKVQEGIMGKIKATASTITHAIASAGLHVGRPLSALHSPPKVEKQTPNAQEATAEAHAQPSKSAEVKVKENDVLESVVNSSSSIEITSKVTKKPSKPTHYDLPKDWKPKIGDNWESKKPQKPTLSTDGKKYLSLALQGNNNIHFYTAGLRTVSLIRQQSLRSDSVSPEP